MPSQSSITAREEAFYSFRDAARLSLVHPSTLRSWLAMGVVKPTLRLVDADDRAIAEGFSLEDVGYLHLLRHLRQRMALADSVKFISHLVARFGPPGPKWRHARVRVTGRSVIAYTPDDDWEVTAAMPGKQGAGQRLWEEFFTELFQSIRGDTASLLIPADLSEWIEISPKHANGLPVVRGTGIETTIVRAFREQYAEQDIIKDIYPVLDVAQIRAAICFEEYLDRRAA